MTNFIKIIISILLLIFLGTTFAQDNFDLEKANTTIHEINLLVPQNLDTQELERILSTLTYLQNQAKNCVKASTDEIKK